MKLTVFDVEHGACALIELPNGTRILIDCGHNSTTGWRPGSYLKSRGITAIDALFITNYDEDHVSGIKDLFENVLVRTIFRNKKVSPQLIWDLKTEEDNLPGPGIDYMIDRLEVYNSPVSFGDLGFDGLSYQTFSHSPQLFDDENNLSLVIFFEYGNWKFVFPGDMEEAGWLELLKNKDFVDAVRGTDIFFASHHGRRNGCCAELYEVCNPYWFVISDKHKGHQTQETNAWYKSRAKGARFNGEDRYVLTTRSDGNIEFNVLPDGRLTAHPILVSEPKYRRI